MTLSKPIDYAAMYFEKEFLDKIPGRPDYTTLARLFKYLKANVSKVTSKLGGGLCSSDDNPDDGLDGFWMIIHMVV